MSKPKNVKTIKSFSELMEGASEEVTHSWQKERDNDLAERASIKKVQPKTPNQEIYFESVKNKTITLCSGPAGCGKTFVSCGLALEMLRDGKFKKIVITRPLVTCGEGIGFLPGDALEKISPYMRPLMDAFSEFIPPKELKDLLAKGELELWPLELMRGASIKNSIIILDEAQNATYPQIHMALTRIDQGSKMIVVGDATSRTQTDLRSYGPNPFKEVMDRLDGHPDIGLVRLTRADILRHDLIAFIDERLSDNVEEI